MTSPLSPSDLAPEANSLEASAAPGADEASSESDSLLLELKRLSEEHQKLLAQMGAAPAAPAAKPAPGPAARPAARAAADPAQLDRMRQENARLKARVAELEQLLEATNASAPPAENWDERQEGYEALLAEKSEVIRELRSELQEYRSRPQMVSPKEEELVNLSEQLERDRRLLQDDEAALEDQTKQMEMNISRQRAEISRQRTEVERMFAELQLEMDQAMRESGLRERLTPLQRRSQEFAVRNGKS